MNTYSIISIIAIVFSLISGIIVYSLAAKRLISKAFLISMLGLIVVEFCIIMIYLEKDFFKIELWGKIAATGLCLVFPTWVTISQLFGRANDTEYLNTRKWYLLLLYGFGLLYAGLIWKYDLFNIPETFPGDLFVITNFGKVFIIFFLVSTVLILINFENTLRLSKISSRKWKQVPFYVLISAFLFWIYGISQVLMYKRIPSKLVLMSLLVIIVTNLMLIFYSIKYGLIQFEVTIGREVAYSSVMIFVVGVYLLLVGIVGKIVQYAGGSVDLFLSFLAALFLFCIFLAALVSKSLKLRIRQFIDRNFYKNRYDYREQWGKFSESISEVINLEEVLAKVTEDITSIFSAQKAAILLCDDRNGVLLVRITRNISGANDLRFYRGSKFIDWLHRLGEAVEISTLFHQAEQIGLTGQEQENLRTLQAVVCVPMITQTKLRGIFVIGEKVSGGNYSKEDFDLLETLANQSSVAIFNAQLNEELIVSREMESLHKLSSFVLHDLRNSVSMLSMIVKNAGKNWENQEFQKDMLSTISNAVRKMKSLISKISSLPDQLEPNRQMVYIDDIIRKVLRDTKINEFKHIKLQKKFQKLPTMAVDPDQIQKVIENFVINALEAQPKGGCLEISTRLVQINFNGCSENGSSNNKGEFAEIEITDTGIGMSDEFIQNRLFKPFQTTKKKGLGIGLYQCKEIITAHGGTIEVKSKEHEGTCFKILLPTSNGYRFTQDSQKPEFDSAISLN